MIGDVRALVVGALGELFSCPELLSGLGSAPFEIQVFPLNSIAWLLLLLDEFRDERSNIKLTPSAPQAAAELQR